MGSRALILVLSLLMLVGCAAGERRFPLREPMWRDTDLEPQNTAAPAAYESSFAWDAADNTIFRPVSRFFAVSPGAEATNVNALDEVPDSSWFENRIGRRAMTTAEIARGSCDEKVLDVSAPDGTWIVDGGKPNGANPGFRVNIPGVGKFMLKADPKEEPERATGAAAIAARLYHAAGWHSPCDSVVYFRPAILKLKPGLTVTDNSGVAKPFDRAALDKLLANASHRGDRVRMVASKWLPGKVLGPFTYAGVREDDPADVIPHEDRRDLRGARVIAAWLNHFDSREQNTMSTWMPEKYVRHYYLDLGDCFGSQWAWDGISRRLGHAYYLDVPYLLEDFVTFGAIARPWERAERTSIFGYFSAKDFDPEAWRGGYPNPAFGRMTEHDAAWAARILARFDRPAIEAAVRAGDFTDERDTKYLVDTLVARRDAITRRWFAKLSPIADVVVRGRSVCGVDLASKKQVCAPIPAGGSDPYRVVPMTTASSKGVLHVHLYDLAEGARIVGLERP